MDKSIDKAYQARWALVEERLTVERKTWTIDEKIQQIDSCRQMAKSLGIAVKRDRASEEIYWDAWRKLRLLLNEKAG